MGGLLTLLGSLALWSVGESAGPPWVSPGKLSVLLPSAPHPRLAHVVAGQAGSWTDREPASARVLLSPPGRGGTTSLLPPFVADPNPEASWGSWTGRQTPPPDGGSDVLTVTSFHRWRWDPCLSAVGVRVALDLQNDLGGGCFLLSVSWTVLWSWDSSS